MIRVMEAAQAAQRLAGLAWRDPRGLSVEADIPAMCAAGLCVEVSDGLGGPPAVVVVSLQNGVAWIEAAGGGGAGNLCPAIDALAAGLPCRAVAFQTARPGLVRRAEKLGYHVAGYIMRRDK